jgi:hypothetical protein
VTFSLGGTWDPTGGPIHVVLSGADGVKHDVADVPPPASGETANVPVIFPDWPDHFGVGLLMAYQGDINNPDIGVGRSSFRRRNEPRPLFRTFSHGDRYFSSTASGSAIRM